MTNNSLQILINQERIAYFTIPEDKTMCTLTPKHRRTEGICVLMSNTALLCGPVQQID